MNMLLADFLVHIYIYFNISKVKAALRAFDSFASLKILSFLCIYCVIVEVSNL